MTPMIDIVFQLLIFFVMTFKIAAVEGDPERAYRALVERSGPDDIVLVTGSIFLIGDVLPVVEPTYRVAAAREREAAVQAGMIAGRP